MRVGRVCVVPPERAGGLRPTDVRLALEPGAAFGTGRHATTRRGLAALQTRLSPGERVVDAGCGTGILAVAACLLGAADATGFDFDANAVAHADELARTNGVADRARFLQADLERLSCGDAGARAGLSAPADGLLATLYGDLVRAHAPALAGLLREGGWFVNTGCLGEVRPAVQAALADAGLQVEELHSRGRWDAFVGTRGARSGLAG
jgi:ribosomal protein L11 methyltransferase